MNYPAVFAIISLMKKPIPPSRKTPEKRSLSAVELVVELRQQLQSKDELIQSKDDAIQHLEHYVALLEEQLRLKRAQQFAASSERHADQISLFDEAELGVAIEALSAQLPNRTNGCGWYAVGQRINRRSCLIRTRVVPAAFLCFCCRTLQVFCKPMVMLAMPKCAVKTT
ncbi:transposase C of IS166 homeodomain protein [Serratia sp. DD3]|nr:transposase C of IS166 homeodomain protein [Serratia sp. DD3]